MITLGQSVEENLIDRLKAAERDRDKQVVDAVTIARYQERDRFAAERKELLSATKIVDLLQYSPETASYYVSDATLAAAGLRVRGGR